MHAQLRSVRLYTAQQRSVAPCGAVRCGAVCPSYSILHGPLFFPPRKVPPYRRSERNTGTKSTQQVNFLCTSSSWHYQIVVRTKSWAPSFCPLHVFLVAFFLALRERSGRRPAARERSPCIYCNHTILHVDVLPRSPFPLLSSPPLPLRPGRLEMMTVDGAAAALARRSAALSISLMPTPHEQLDFLLCSSKSSASLLSSLSSPFEFHSKDRHILILMTHPSLTFSCPLE